MKRFIFLLITLLLLLNFNIPVRAIDNINDEETKAAINKENKNGMTLALTGTFAIIIILTYYKKKKISI